MTSMSQISNQSTPVASKKAKETEQKAKRTGDKKKARSVKGKKQAEKQPNEVSQVMDDFEAIEEFFKVLDDDIEFDKCNKKSGAKGKKDDSGIDPTIVNDHQAITILESTTMMATTGFHSLDFNDDLEGFGTESGMDFQKIFLESDEVSDLLNNKRAASYTPQKLSKRRRLTYGPIEIENVLDKSFNRDPQNEYEMPEIGSNFQAHVSNLDEYTLNDQEVPINDIMSEQVEDILMQQEIENSVMSQQFDEIPMLQQIKNIPSFHQIEDYAMQEIPEISRMHQILENQGISQQSDHEPQSPEIQSELILGEIQELPQKRNKKHKLIVDKNVSITKKTMQKNIDDYIEKYTVIPPLADFETRWNKLKSNEAVLFASSSYRLKHSNVLRDLFDRNLKNIQLRAKKRKQAENFKSDEENEIVPNLNRHKTLRNHTKAMKNLNQDNIIHEIYDGVVAGNPHENVENDKENETIPNVKRRRKTLRSHTKALKDRNGENNVVNKNQNVIVTELLEIEIPQMTPNIHNELEIPQIEELELPPVSEVRRNINIEYDG